MINYIIKRTTLKGNLVSLIDRVLNNFMKNLKVSKYSSQEDEEGEDEEDNSSFSLRKSHTNESNKDES